MTRRYDEVACPAKRHPRLSVGSVMRYGLLLLAFLVFATAAHAQEAATYTVRQGDTLYGIARSHGLTVEQLQLLNDLDGTAIRIGQVLRLAAPEPEATPDTGPEAPAAAEPELPAQEEPAPGTVAVERGDTFYTLGRRYGVAADTLWRLNDRSTEPLQPGTTVRVPAAAVVEAETYRVRGGDTLFGLARRFGVSVEALRTANDLRSDALQAGQTLRIPGRGAPVREAPREAPVTEGEVLPYPPTFHGRFMADGHAYDSTRFTVSHPDWPLGTVVLLSHPENGRQTFAEVTDRGPLDPAFVMDVSAAVVRALGLTDGDRRVTARVVR